MPTLKPSSLKLFRSRHGTRWKMWDLAVGVVAFSIAFLLTPHKQVMPQPYYILVVGSMFGVMLMIFSRMAGVPNPEQRRSRYELFTLATIAVVITYLVFSVVIGLFLLKAYGRYIVVTTTGLSFAGLTLPRILVSQLLRMQPLRLILYGAGDKAAKLLPRIADDPHFEVVGFLDNNPQLHGKERFGHKVFGSIQTVGSLALRDMNTDIVVICVAAAKLVEENARAIMELPLDQIEVLNQGAFLEYYFKEISVEFGCPQWFASAPSLPGNPSIFVAKRLMDLGASIIGLTLTLPFWPLIGLAIRLDGPGPIFFRQTRVGFHGRHFTIYKFRTMAVDAEKDGPQWATEKDPRVTRIGSFLRVTRLDELPQLLNVLKGNMTLVGPRPERPEFVQQLAEEIPYYEHRHLVPPGLTGWAQVRYHYGASKEDAVRKLQYELYYVRHLSLVFDIEVLLRTIPLMAKGSR